MPTIVLLFVFFCSVVSAPIGEISYFNTSVTGLSSSPFELGPAEIQQALPQIPAYPPTAVSSGSVSGSSWSMSPHITDLSSFHMLDSPIGNIKVITGTPPAALSASSLVTSFSKFNDNSSAIEVFYPQGSVNPGNKIIGGGEFYASPLLLSKARNVSLEYSVFFPLDFDWVQGGKLPGLYGGHKTCSGGDNALTCFSTRLMWRNQGAGELYLYAPKDKQTAALCATPPRSVCESNYGLSIARGSFSFKAGSWNHVKQTVHLNTPGQQDGTFLLEVEGKPVINLNDVYYRNGIAAQGPSLTSAASIPRPPLIGVIGRLATLLASPFTSSQIHQGVQVPTIAEISLEPIGFTGLFFSTFFGGHTNEWATPKDQYAWFKGFSISINS